MQTFKPWQKSHGQDKQGHSRKNRKRNNTQIQPNTMKKFTHMKLLIGLIASKSKPTNAL